MTAPTVPYGELTTQGASSNIAWHHTSVDRDARARQRGHRSCPLYPSDAADELTPSSSCGLTARHNTITPNRQNDRPDYT